MTMSNQRINFKNIKLIALDIDGTSMNSKSEITGNTRKVIQQLANRYIVVPTTGRGFFGLREHTLKVENIRYVISANGAVVTDGQENKRLYESLIPYKVAALIVKKYTRADTLVYIHRNDKYSSHIFGCLDEDYYNQHFKQNFRMEFQDLHNQNLKEYIENDQRNVIKIGIRFTNEKDLEIAKKEIVESFPEVNVFSVGNIGIEITERAASKKEALIKLCSYLKINFSEVLAIGDNGNDVGMLEWSGTGVAMKNAVDSCKYVADYICDDNDHEGAANFFEQYLL